MILPITLQGVVDVGGGVGVGVVVSIVDKLCKLSAWTSGNQAKLTSGRLDLLQNSNLPTSPNNKVQYTQFYYASVTCAPKYCWSSDIIMVC